uniref:Uncharacterized protein n=1 Tax=Globisporangium ultimum (strain ATCC 200006 / CBS 805.95 / DAOM BR144) TaxID=431595 RepID=K3WX55_GLOUD
MRVSIGLDERNTKKRTPIHFGDQICFISDASDLPLSIGDNGRTCRVQNLSVGPHMMFTIVDFRNPTRHTEVTASDEFWLRVDTTLFDPDWGCSVDEYDVRSLLSDTQFFLGCAGSIDDERDTMDSCFSNELPTSTNEHLHGTAGKYALPRLSLTRQKQARRNTSESHSHDTFRLVAMKATVPAVEYYGDDKATREYTMETNEHIMRLARWKFAANNESIHGSSSLPKPHNTSTPRIDTTCEESLLLNCTSVYLSLNHFIVEYERDWERAVMRDYSKRCNGLEEAIDFLKKRGKRQALPASWQIRLLHQGLRPESPTKAVANSQFGPRSNSPLKVLGEITASPIEWLRTKHELMEKNEAKIKEKRSLVRAAKQSYEQVAKQSNSKLAEIEKRKAQHQLAYFQNRYHAIFTEDADERTDHG